MKIGSFIFIPSFFLFLISFGVYDKLLNLVFVHNYQQLESYLSSLKELLFAFNLIVITYPIFEVGFNRNKLNFISNSFKSILWPLVTVFVAIFLLTFSTSVKSMAVDYSKMAIDPFDLSVLEQSGYPIQVYNKRILMSYIASLFGIDSEVLFFQYSMVLSFVFIALLIVWFKNHRISISVFGIISICTSSFVIQQFLSPGYPDQLVYIFVMLTLIFRMDKIQLISLTTLCLLTHELSIFLLIPLILFKYPKEYRIELIITIVLYISVWILDKNFDLSSGVSQHKTGGYSSLEWLLKEPIKFLIGMFISYKLLWLIFPISFYNLLVFSRNTDEILFHLSIWALTFFVIVMAVDTSRLIGLSFISFLFSLKVIDQNTISKTKKYHTIFNGLLLLNLLIPSFYLGLNSTADPGGGIYNYYFEFLKDLFGITYYDISYP